jgi:hypothetical protein
MLSEDGLVTFSWTEPPGSAIVGVMVISTGSGPVVRLTVDVETPQAWRLSATDTGDERLKRVLRDGNFIDTAGTLIVREPSRRNTRPSSAENSGGCACCCAVPYEFGKEHTPTKRLDVYWKSGQGLRPLCSDDTAKYGTPLGDRRHFIRNAHEIP